jgi:hypothetical protein
MVCCNKEESGDEEEHCTETEFVETSSSSQESKTGHV